MFLNLMFIVYCILYIGYCLLFGSLPTSPSAAIVSTAVKTQLILLANVFAVILMLFLFVLWVAIGEKSFKSFKSFYMNNSWVII